MSEGLLSRVIDYASAATQMDTDSGATQMDYASGATQMDYVSGATQTDHASGGTQMMGVVHSSANLGAASRLSHAASQRAKTRRSRAWSFVR